MSRIALLGLTLLILHGDAVPSTSRNSTAVTSTQGGACGQVVVHNNIEGGRDGPPGPRGEAGPAGPPGPPGGGVTYTRWGRTTCPTTEGTQLVYEGAVVGSNRTEGGSAEYLCLHNQPDFLQVTPGMQRGRATLTGTQFRFNQAPAFTNMLNHDPPCSVCYTPSRSTKITIPGKVFCPSSWTREYYGYLMTELSQESFKSRVPICVDANAESIAGSAVHTEGSALLFVEATCAGIKCPPYSNGAEITCVVCTK